MSSPLGSLLGYVLPVLVFSPNFRNIKIEKKKAEIQLIMIIQAVYTTILAIFVCIFWCNPPSPSIVYH